MALLTLSYSTYIACVLFIIIIALIKYYYKILEKKKNSTIKTGQLPGPKPRLPIIGNLHLLRGYKIPYQAFTDLSKKYGKVYHLQLGTVSSVVVHGLDNIREVLIQKSNHFDSRPNFDRYHQLFDGNKENSLAFCNWSNVQKKRRDLLKDHVFPKIYTDNYKQLNELICYEIRKMIDDINKNALKKNKLKKPDDVHIINNDDDNNNKSIVNNEIDINNNNNNNNSNNKILFRLIESRHVDTIVRFSKYANINSNNNNNNNNNSTTTVTKPVIEPQNPVSIKDYLLPTCGKIFLRYFCSAADMITNNDEYISFVNDFDKIFYEVNQGYAYDFLPFLNFLYVKKIKKVIRHSENIRKFVLKHLIHDRLRKNNNNNRNKIDSAAADNNNNNNNNDFLDCLLKNVITKDKKDDDDDDDGVVIDMETALFSLEDIIGGHSAIGNFLVKLLTFLVDNKTVQDNIKKEVDRREKDFISLNDRQYMPYTECVIMEGLRMLSSPIVPHVSNQDTTIAGYHVKKDTLIFLNNYELNMSETLWSNPLKFDPTRFINVDTGVKTKPAHFLPFGGGKRSCMGYKLVQFISFVFLANVVNNFEIVSVPGEKYNDVTIGNLSLPTQTFKFDFRLRTL